MSTHTVQSGSVIHGYLSLPIHGGRPRGMQEVIISAYEIETAVLSEVEQKAALREAVRPAVYDGSAKVKVELIAPLGGNMERGDAE